MQTAMAQGEMSQNLAWNNRVQSLQDDIDLYTYINGRNLAINERIGNETQILTNQIWKGSPFTQYGTGMYAGQAASNWNAVNTAINSTCSSCTAQYLRFSFQLQLLHQHNNVL